MLPMCSWARACASSITLDHSQSTWSTYERWRRRERPICRSAWRQKTGTRPAKSRRSIVTDAQKLVQEAIDRLVESGVETGVQVAAYRRGELVVDAVAGVADAATGRPLTADTPIFSASPGKNMTSTARHGLAERGGVRYATPIRRPW